MTGSWQGPHCAREVPPAEEERPRPRRPHPNKPDPTRPGRPRPRHLVSQAATVLMLLGNPARCAATLGSCPAAGPRFSSLTASLARATSLFSTRPHFPGAPAAAPTPLQSCVALATGAELLSLCAVLHVTWGLQRRARLAFARGLDDVTQEWLLERSARGMVSLALELAAVGLLCWQVAELWFFLAPPSS